VTALAALLGALIAACVAGAFVALRGFDAPPPAPAPDPYALPRPSRMDRLNLRLICAFAAGAAIALFTRWPVGTLLAGVGGFLAPSLVGAKAARQRALARTEAIGHWTEMLRDVMAAGGGLEQSIIATAAVAPLAIRSEVTVLAARLERQPLVPALRAFSSELDDPVGDLVTAALVLSSQRTPKKLGELLSSLARTARDRATMHLRVETGRARTRSSVRIILGVTIGFSTLLVVFNPTYVKAYSTFAGQCVLVGVVGLYVAAYRWIARAGREETTERFLVGAYLPTDDDAPPEPEELPAW